MFGNRSRSGVLAGVLAMSLAYGGSASSASAQVEFDWQLGLPPLTGVTYAATVWDDGSGPKLYLGGDFSMEAFDNYVYSWDGTGLAVVGGPITHPSSYTTVNALTVYNGALIAAGDFTFAGGVAAHNIARWTGTQWAPLAEGYWEDVVYAMTTYNGELVVGGAANSMPKIWNGTSWRYTPSGGPHGAVHALTVYNGQLIAGGYFTHPSGGVVAFDGVSWRPFPSGLNGWANALTVYNGDLIAGGTIWSAGGVPASHIARWNGSQWSALGSGVGGYGVNALAVFNDELVVGGSFRGAGMVPASLIARWSDGAWSSFDGGIDYSGTESEVKALAVWNGHLAAGGWFSTVGGMPSRYWALWGPSGSTGTCDDGLFCNGAETCDQVGDPVPGTPPCGEFMCRESDDQCVECLGDGDCSDGLFCNGEETCDAGGDCQPGAAPCSTQACNEGDDVCESTELLWASFTGATSVPNGVGTVQNEDIVAWDPATGAWSLVFNGSDVGLSGAAIGGLARLSNGDILLSFTVPFSIPSLIGGPSGTSVDDSDIVRFTPTSLGTTTSGSFAFYFDGSDVGLTTSGEVIDAIAITPDGRLILSTTGSFGVSGASGSDADLVRFTATSLGSVTSGAFAMYFDGSDVGLTTTGEDVDAVSVTNAGLVLLSTLANYGVPGLSGADEDVFQFTPASLGSTTSGSFAAYLDSSTEGISASANISAAELITFTAGSPRPGVAWALDSAWTPDDALTTDSSLDGAGAATR